MKKLLTFAPVLAVLALSGMGCAKAPDRTYDENGISFTYPGDWSVTEESSEFGIYTLILEKNGATSSGIAIITHFDKEIMTSEEWAESYIATLGENPDFEEFAAAPPVAGTYGDYPAEKITYTMSVMGLAHSGTVWLIETEERAASVSLQQIDEDNDRNKAGFDLMESTFSME